MNTLTSSTPEIVAVPRKRIDRYWLLVLPLLALLAVLYLFPLLRVLWLSFSVPQPGLQNYARFIDNASVHRVLWTTLRICSMTTVISVALGYAIAFAMVHVGPRQRMALFFGLLVPFWASVLIRAFSWLFLLGEQGLVNNTLMALGMTDEPLQLMRNPFGVVVGMVHFMIPYAVLPLYSNMKGIDPQLARASQGLGASAFLTFRKVYFPQTLPGIYGAGLLVFIFSLGFYVTPVILGGGRTVMVAEYISTQILQLVNWGSGAALASVLLMAIVAVLVALSRFINLRELFGAK
ncbi:ABC transporter permease [Paraburkholderia pallida]|uniref:ABC transporter permease n=1 Tax=Paraburkholderia pallida TaxID=2547399 RepID=A0A4P7D0C8_9BURK|nr:ABC transporter permease [Paraburkholderia pallida]QBR02076.1 ABC transporter permease [Paraburkholderia pallida]